MSSLPYNINSINWGKLSDIKSLTEIHPTRQFDNALLFFYIFLFITVLAVSLMILSRRLSKDSFPKKRFFRSVWQTLLVESLLGFILLLSRLYQIPFISARLWLVALFVTVFAMVIYFIDYYQHNLPGNIKTYDEEQLRMKYLPKKKKK